MKRGPRFENFRVDVDWVYPGNPVTSLFKARRGSRHVNQWTVQARMSQNLKPEALGNCGVQWVPTIYLTD